MSTQKQLRATGNVQNTNVNASPKNSNNQPDKPKDSKLHALIDLQDNAYYKAIEQTLTNCRPAPPPTSSTTTTKLEQKWHQRRLAKHSSRSPKGSKNSSGGNKNEHNDGRPVISTSFLDKTYHRLKGKFHRLRKKTSDCSTAVTFRDHVEGCTGSNCNRPRGTEKITSTKIGGTDCDYVQETIIERSVMTASGVQTTTKHIIKRCDKNGHVDVEIEENIPKSDKKKPKNPSCKGLDENLPNDYFYESMHAITARENREYRIGGAGCGRPPTCPQPQIVCTPAAGYQPESEFRAPPMCRPLPVTRPSPNQNRPCLCPQLNQQRQSNHRSSEALQELLKNLCTRQNQQRQSCQHSSDVLQESMKNRPSRPCQCTQQNRPKQSCLRSSDAHISALQQSMLSDQSAQSCARPSRASTADGIDHCLLDCCPALCRFCTKYLASKLSIQPDTIDQRTLNSFVVRNSYNGKPTIDYFRVGEAMQQRERERRKSEELERSRSVIDACGQSQANRGDRSRRSKSLSEIVQPIYKQPAKSPKKTNFRKARDEPQYVVTNGKRSRQRIPDEDAQIMPTEKKRRKKRELEPVQSTCSTISVEPSTRGREKKTRPREQDVRQKVKASAKEDAYRPQYAERRGAVKKKASFDPSIGGKSSILKLPQAQKSEPRQPQSRQPQARQPQPRQPQSRQPHPSQPQSQVSCTQSELSNQSSSEKYIYKFTHAQVQGLLKEALLAQQNLQAQQTNQAPPAPQNTYTQTGASIQYPQGQSLVQAQPASLAPTQYPQAQAQGLAQPQPQPSVQASVPQYSTIQDPDQYPQTQDQGLKRVPSVSFAQPEQTIFQIPSASNAQSQSLPTTQCSPRYAQAQDICMSCLPLETGVANQYAQPQAQGMQQQQFAPYYQQTSPYIQTQATGLGQVPAGPPQYSQVQQMGGPTPYPPLGSTPSQISIPPQCIQYLQQICSSMQLQQTPGPEKEQAPPGPVKTAKNSQNQALNMKSSAAKASPARPSQTGMPKTRQASTELISSQSFQAQNAGMRQSPSCLCMCCPQYCQAQTPMQYPQPQVLRQYPQAQAPIQYSQAQAPIQYPQAPSQFPQAPPQYPQAPPQYPQTQAPMQYPQAQGFDMYQSQPCNCGQPNCYPAPYYATQTTNFRQTSPGPISQAGGPDIRQPQAFQYPQSQLGPSQYTQAQNPDIRLSQPCVCKSCASQHRLAQVPDYRQATSGQRKSQAEDSQQRLGSPSRYRPTKAPARGPVTSAAQSKRNATPNRAAQRPSFTPNQSGARAPLPDRKRPLNTNQKQLGLPKIKSSYSQADEDEFDEAVYGRTSLKAPQYRQSRGQVVSPTQSRFEESSPRRSIPSQQRNIGQPRVDSRKQPAQTERSVKSMRQREPLDDYESYSEGYESEPVARISAPEPRKYSRQDEDKMKKTSQPSKPPRKQSTQSNDDQTERTQKRGKRALSPSAPVAAHRSSMEEICRSFCFGDDAQQQFTNALPRGSRVTTEIVIPKRNAENMKNELGHDVFFNTVVHSRPEIDDGKDTVFVNSQFQVKQGQGMRRISFDPKGKRSSAMETSCESQMTDPQVQADDEEYVERKKVKKSRTSKDEQKQREARGGEPRPNETRRKQSSTSDSLPSRGLVEERRSEKNADRDQRIRDGEKEMQPWKTRQGTKGTSDQKAARQSKLQTIEEQPSQEKGTENKREKTERAEDRRQYDAQPRYPSYAAAVTDGSKSGVREAVRAALTPPKDSTVYDEQRQGKSHGEGIDRREPDRQQEKCQRKFNLDKEPSYNQAKGITTPYPTFDGFMEPKVRQTEQPKSAYAQPERNADEARRMESQGATRSVESARQAYGQQERQPQPSRYATDSRQIQSSMQPYGSAQDARSYQMPQRPLPAQALRPDYAAQTVSGTDGAAYSPTERQMRPQEVPTRQSFTQAEFRPNYGDGYRQFAQPEKTQSPVRSQVFTSQAAFKPDEGYQPQSAKPVYDQRETPSKAQQPQGYAQGTPPGDPSRPCQCYLDVCRPFQPTPGFAYAPSDRQMIPQSPTRQPSYASQEKAQPMYYEPGRQMAPPFQQGTQPLYAPSQAPVPPQMQAGPPRYAPSTQQAFAQTGPVTPQTQAGPPSYAPSTRPSYAPSGAPTTPQNQAGTPSYAPLGQPSYAPVTPHMQARLPSYAPSAQPAFSPSAAPVTPQTGPPSYAPSTQPALSQPGGPLTPPIQRGHPSFASSAGTQSPMTPQFQPGPPSFAPSTPQVTQPALVQPEAPKTPQLQPRPPSSAPLAVAQPPYAQPVGSQTPQSQTGPPGLTPSAVVTPSEGSQLTAEQQTAAEISQVNAVKPSIEPAKPDVAQDQPKEGQKLPSISKPAQARESLPVKAAVSQQKIPEARTTTPAKPEVPQAKVAARSSVAQSKPRPSAAAKSEKEKLSPKPEKTDSVKSVPSTPKKSVSTATVSSATKMPKVPPTAAKSEKEKPSPKTHSDSEKSIPSTPKISVSAVTVASAARVPPAVAKLGKEKPGVKPVKTDSVKSFPSTPKRTASAATVSSAAKAPKEKESSATLASATKKEPRRSKRGSKTDTGRSSTPKKAAKSDIKSSAAAARSQTMMLKELEKPTKPIEPKPAKKPAAKPAKQKVKASKPVSGSEYESEKEAPPQRTKPVMGVAEYKVATPKEAPPTVKRKRTAKPPPPPAEPSSEEYSTEEEEVVIPQKPAKEPPPARKAPVVVEESSTESETASSEDAVAPVMEAAASSTESESETESETATSSESESGAEEVEEEAEEEEEPVEAEVPEPVPAPVAEKLTPVEKPKPKSPFCKPVRKCSVGRRSSSKAKKPAPIVICYTPRTPRCPRPNRDIVMCDTNAPSPLCECKQMCFNKPVRSTSCSSKKSTSQARKRSSSRG